MEMTVKVNLKYLEEEAYLDFFKKFRLILLMHLIDCFVPVKYNYVVNIPNFGALPFSQNDI